MNPQIDPTRPYTTYEIPADSLVQIAWDGSRVWVCVDGKSLLRAKWCREGLAIDFQKQEEADRVTEEDISESRDILLPGASR